jgi:hypothetical protein
MTGSHRGFGFGGILAAPAHPVVIGTSGSFRQTHDEDLSGSFRQTATFVMPALVAGIHALALK